MLQYEFEKITKLNVTAEEYAYIEDQYNNAPESWSKFKFCSEWMKDDGVGFILRGRMIKIRELEEKVEELEKEIRKAGENADNAWDEAERWERRFREEKEKRDLLICEIHRVIA